MTRLRCAAIAAVMASLAAAADLRTAAPDFTLESSKGKALHLSNYKGKVVLLNFWATWCHGCKEELPWLVEFEERHKRGGLATIGVAMDEDGWRSVTPFLKTGKLNFPIVVGNEEVAKRYGTETLPVTLLIDGEGKIAATFRDLIDREACETEIRKLLNESTAKNRRAR